MSITIFDIIAWLIIGALAGSFTGMLVKRKKQGYGRFTNIGIGLVGAIVGGVLFEILGIDFGLGNITVSAKDLVAAFIGSLLFLVVLWFIRKRREGSGGDDDATGN